MDFLIGGILNNLREKQPMNGIVHRILDEANIFTHEEAIEFFQDMKKNIKIRGELQPDNTRRLTLAGATYELKESFGVIETITVTNGPRDMPCSMNLYKGELTLTYSTLASLGGCTGAKYEKYAASGECEFAVSGIFGKFSEKYIAASFDVSLNDEMHKVKLTIDERSGHASATVYRYIFPEEIDYSDDEEELGFEKVYSLGLGMSPAVC